MHGLKLTQNRLTLLDNQDFEEFSKHKWCYQSNGYAGYFDSKTKKTILLHRLILNAPTKRIVDHINGNKLDNRRENLRLCNYSQNLANAKGWNTNSSGTRGVHWHKQNNNWRAFIHVNGKFIHLGSFVNKQKAVLARDIATKKYFGEFARRSI